MDINKLNNQNPCFTKRKRVIKDLVQGKKNTNQLQTLLLLQNPSTTTTDHGSSVDELLREILTSFTGAISELDTWGIEEFSEFCKSKDSGGESTDKEKKHRRCGYKRRKSSVSWMVESQTMEDGCAWRKYGQKNILNSIYPRCYFRCTHKYDQDCRASKQVERMNENPIMYQTTYFGHHTCDSLITTCNPPKHESITSQSDPTIRSMQVEETKVQRDHNVSSHDVSSSTTTGSNVWLEELLHSSSSMADDHQHDCSYFEQVVSSGLDMEDFSQFDDFHFEAIE